WEQYKDWNFHLDMAFDLSSVTVRDSRQVVKTTTDSTQDSTKDVTGQVTGQNNRQQTTQTDGTTTRNEEDTVTRTEQNTQSGDGSYALNQQVTESGEGTESGTTHSATTLTEGGSTEQNTEQSTEGQVKTKTTVTRETYTADTKQVNWDLTTDIAALDKTVEPDGIRLVWTVLRQQTQLPGRLRATLRAVGASYAQVKKSAMMIFEVEPAVIAYAAAELPVSEFEQMERRMDALCEQARQHAAAAESYASAAWSSENAAALDAAVASSCADTVEEKYTAVTAMHSETREMLTQVQSAADTATDAASECFDHRDAAAESVLEAAGHAGDARTYMLQAETYRNAAVERALAAGMASEDAKAYAQQAQLAAAETAADIGDIGQALDSILRMQETLIGILYFTLDGEPYPYVKGSTWGDWLDSTYCPTDNFKVAGNYVNYYRPGAAYPSGGVAIADKFVKLTDPIIVNGMYVVTTSAEY
ncbi:MAG: hypothetical protein IKU51_07215, partial [Clostridia bacterium]|nr:hypothetical protein [Clostridia bacterium]